jgi:restriction system protein
MSTLGDNDVGLFVAAGGFTKDAEKEAREQEKQRITLLDLEGLFDLWVEHYKSVPEEERSLLRLRFVPYLAPDA